MHMCIQRKISVNTCSAHNCSLVKEGPWVVDLTLGPKREWMEICDIVTILYHKRAPIFTRVGINENFASHPHQIIF